MQHMSNGIHYVTGIVDTAAAASGIIICIKVCYISNLRQSCKKNIQNPNIMDRMLR